MLGKEANTGLNTPSGGTPLPKKKDDDDEIPPTQPDPDDAMGGTPPAVSFEVWSSKSFNEYELGLIPFCQCFGGQLIMYRLILFTSCS